MGCVVKAAWIGHDRAAVYCWAPELPGDVVAFMEHRKESRLPQIGQAGTLRFENLNYPECGMADRHWVFD